MCESKQELEAPYHTHNQEQRESEHVSLLHSLPASCIHPRTQTKGMVPLPCSLGLTNEKISWGWRDGSVVKSTCCSSRETEFYSQYLLGCLQLFHSSSKRIQDPLQASMGTKHTLGTQTKTQTKYPYT